MKKLVFGLIATVMLSVSVNAHTGELETIQTNKETESYVSNEENLVIRGKIIKYLIAAISSFWSDDTPSTVTATGAYSKGTCNAINTNICSFTYRLANTNIVDIKQLNTNSTVLDTPVMRKVIENDLIFLSFDENGSVYLTVSDKTKQKLFTSGKITQTTDAFVDSDQIKQINAALLEINPRGVPFTGVKAGTTLLPENGGDGFIYVKLN